MKAPKTKSHFSHLDLWLLIAIILFGFALYYLPVRTASFHFDDNNSIVNNAAIRTIDIPRIFNSFNTRFLVGLSFALNYKFFALHPTGYRLTNILIHCFNAVLVYLLIKSTLYLYQARKPVFPCRLEWPAFFASMLFLCHPIQTEPVNFTTQRFVLMGTLFYLLTLVLYIQYRCQCKKRYLIASMGSAIAAMLCKEFVVTLPVMLALYDLYFLGPFNESIGKRCKRLIPFFAIVLIVPILLLRTPLDAVGVARIAESKYIEKSNKQKVISHIDITRANGSMGRQRYFLTELNVVCTYVRLLFLPVNQNVDYDYPFTNEMDAKTLMSAAFLLGLLAIAAVTYKSYRMISFGILWFFIALSVESSFIPIGHVIAEYRLYLASVGFVFLVTNFIYIRKVDIRLLNVIAGVILIALSVLTFQRNKVWKNEFTLWDDTVRKSPHKARPYNNRGNVYLEEGNFALAMSDYSKAIEVDPKYAQPYNNRGVIYAKQNNDAQALLNYNKAIELDPSFEKFYYNRGAIYLKEKDFDQAILDYGKAIEINPVYAEAYANRGNAYTQEAKFTQAMVDFAKAIELNPEYVVTYIDRGSAFAQQGDFTNARLDYNKAIELNPNLADIYNDLGNIDAKKEGPTQSILDYNKAIEINPHYEGAYYDRGIIYAEQNNFTQAMVDFTKAIELNPRYEQAYYNRGIIYVKEGKTTQALSDFTKVIEINPENAEVYKSRGFIFAKEKKLAEALSDYSKAIEIDPQDAEVYNNRGFIYANQNNFTQALSDFTKATEINPKNAEAYNNQGLIYSKQNNFTQAILDYTKAIEINPDYAGAYYNRAFSYYQLKEYDKAWGDVQKLEKAGVAVDPNFINALKQALGQDK